MLPISFGRNFGIWLQREKIGCPKCWKLVFCAWLYLPVSSTTAEWMDETAREGREGNRGIYTFDRDCNSFSYHILFTFLSFFNHIPFTFLQFSCTIFLYFPFPFPLPSFPFHTYSKLHRIFQSPQRCPTSKSLLLIPNSKPIILDSIPDSDDVKSTRR